MYAILKTGGRQYKVQAGDIIRVEKLEKELGSELELKEILAVGSDNGVVGSPTVANASVTAVVTRQEKGPKVIVFKKKRRQGYRRMKGHRQFFTELFIKSISFDGKVTSSDKNAQVFDPEQIAAKKEARILKHLVADAAQEASAPKTAKKVTKKKAATKKVATKKTAKKVAKKATKKATKKTSKK